MAILKLPNEETTLSEEEIQHAWYSLGLRGQVSDWNTKYRFAREIEKLIKAKPKDKS